MGTDWKLRPRQLRPLTDKILGRLNLLVGLDEKDPEETERVGEMHEEIRRALEAYPHQAVWMDRARPENQLAGLAQFKKRLAALVETHEHLDDVTWQDIDQAYESGLADSRRESSIRLALDEIAAAVASVENGLKKAKQRKSAQHPPTTEARQELIKELVCIFAEYAPKGSENPKDEGLERLKFIRTVLKAAGVPCPARDENLQTLIDRELAFYPPR